MLAKDIISDPITSNVASLQSSRCCIVCLAGFDICVVNEMFFVVAVWFSSVVFHIRIHQKGILD